MKIVIVEDDVMLADFLEMALQGQGHEVCGVAANVTDGVALVRFHHPDIAVLDMRLGSRELGTDVARQLAESDDLAGVGVLYTSGVVEEVMEEARFGHACLGKPYNMSELEAALAIVRDLALGHAASSVAMPRGLHLLSRGRSEAECAAWQLN